LAGSKIYFGRQQPHLTLAKENAVKDQGGKRLLGAGMFALVASAALGAGLMCAKNAASERQRTFEFTYQVHVPATVESKSEERLWIPLPQTDEHQSIRKLSIESRVAHKVGKEQEYGNSYAFFTPTPEQAATGYDIALQFEVTRREYARDLKATNTKMAQATEATMPRYLQPDKMVPLNATIAELARTQTAGATEPVEKAHRIYKYVASTMRYDKSGEGWGRGDEMWACDSKRGNCTDFHSVLIGMMRSSGIPARFEIGFQVPESKSEGDISGYHCWAEFYVNEIGWVPVDASEASKNPAKRDYFFGAVDPDRVVFTYGRDIRLSKEQKGEPLNYFIYPYAESNGQAVKGLTTHFAFRDLQPPGRFSSGN
jgi:transglutaminase-like putative cysteine protease